MKPKETSDRHPKQFPIIQIAFLLIFSILLNACSTTSRQTSNSNSAVTQDVSRNQTETVQSNATMSNMAAAGAPLSPSEMKSRQASDEDQKTSAERYAEINENPFLEASRAPLSTFSIDVDTASYANVRRFLNDGQMPPKDAVRTEELINYFEYDYPQPVGNVPFSVTTEAAACPWNQNHRIVSIGLQGKKVSLDNVPPSNLVFLVDVSGSMNESNKLPLLKQGLKLLVNQLSAKDRVAIVVYAGNSGLALPSTSAGNKQEILSSLNQLEAGGSTNGGQGIQLAYKIAQDNFIKGGNNRVILATDGDFNVGLTGDNELVKMIESKRLSGVFLSVLGFGTGNTNDSMMEKLADKGNGNYAYIDTIEEARKALGSQAAGTLYTIAKDVKIQVEFNPAQVAGYRLIGYENRLLADRDFNDDKKDAGEIGAGTSVTALYEVVPIGQKVENPGVDALKYSDKVESSSTGSNELLTVKLRYKDPNETESKLMSIGLIDKQTAFESASDNLQFATAVAGFGLLLRDSRYKGAASYNKILNMVERASGNDLKGYRAELASLIGKAKKLERE